jgi:hypothetical protein
MTSTPTQRPTDTSTWRCSRGSPVRRHVGSFRGEGAAHELEKALLVELLVHEHVVLGRRRRAEELQEGVVDHQAPAVGAMQLECDRRMLEEAGEKAERILDGPEPLLLVAECLDAATPGGRGFTATSAKAQC